MSADRDRLLPACAEAHIVTAAVTARPRRPLPAVAPYRAPAGISRAHTGLRYAPGPRRARSGPRHTAGRPSHLRGPHGDERRT